MVQDASGTLKVFVNDPNDTITSTTFPTEVHLAGEFDTSTSEVNNLKYNGAKFSVSSAGVDANGNTFLNLKSDSTSAINISDTKIKVLHMNQKMFKLILKVELIYLTIKLNILEVKELFLKS